jgi:isocitrate dehydrogenase
VGLAGSANIGDHVAMFEAIHGSAPRLAGQDLANPSGLLLAAVMMLVHIGQTEAAEHVHNALLKTIEDGIHTGDVNNSAVSGGKVGTSAFASAVIERLGQTPTQRPPMRYLSGAPNIQTSWTPRPPARKEMVGVDVFLDWREGTPDQLAARLLQVNGGDLALSMVTNRGVKVWPGGVPETFCTDHWRCRFLGPEGRGCDNQQVIELLRGLESARLDFIKMEQLYTFDGEPGFSLGQGQ